MYEKLSNFFETEYGKGFQSGFITMAAIFALFYVLCTGYDRYNGNTDSTISTIESNQRHVIEQLGVVGAGLSNAESSIAGASERIERSQKLIERSTEQLSEIQKRLNECRKLAEREQQIINNLEATNRSRAKAGEKN